jgi:hypothetical protein
LNKEFKYSNDWNNDDDEKDEKIFENLADIGNLLKNLFISSSIIVTLNFGLIYSFHFIYFFSYLVILSL